MSGESTYREMTTEHMGGDTTEADLARFRAACEARQAETGETDEVVTDWMWRDGDYYARMCQYTPDWPAEDANSN